MEEKIRAVLADWQDYITLPDGDEQPVSIPSYIMDDMVRQIMEIVKNV